MPTVFDIIRQKQKVKIMKKIYFTSIGLFILCFLISCSKSSNQSNSSPAEIKQIYEQSVEAGDTPQREELRREIIRQAPNSAYGYFSKAWLLQKNGSDDYEKIIALYNQAIDLEPTLAIAYYNRGIAFKDLGENDKAIEDYSEAIRLNPNHVDAYINRGIVYRRMDYITKAIKDYNQALKMEPNHANAYYNRAIAYMSNDNQQAINDFNKSIELGNNGFLVYYNRGITYDWMNDYSHAIDDYNRAIELNPRYDYTYLDIGRIYVKTFKFEKAVEFFQKALEITRRQEIVQEANYELGRVYIVLKDYKKAKEHLAAAEEKNKTGREAARLLETLK